MNAVTTNNRAVLRHSFNVLAFRPRREAQELNNDAGSARSHFLTRSPWFWGQLAGNVLVVAAVLAFVYFHSTGKGTTLTTGCDMNGGAPYYIENNGVISGFEARLVNYLAAKQNTRAEFVQGSWPNLLLNLDRGDVRLVANGYEWSPERERSYASTIPYYVYKLRLITRKDSPIRTWDDLRNAEKGYRVGVLLGSTAETFLTDNFGETVTVKGFGDEGSTGILTQVVNRQLDATIQDTPATLYYLNDPQYQELEARDEAVAPGYYVIYVRKNDGELLDQLNRSLREGLADGSLRRIYEDYGLWNDDQEELRLKAFDWPPEVSAPETGLWTYVDYFWLLVKAAGVTIVLAVVSMPLAMSLGLIVAVGRLYGPWWVDRPLRGYVELLRGTPLLLQVFVIYFLLPVFGLNVPALVAAVIGLAVNYSAYEAENYRAGLLAVPRGQMEAALSLGMGQWAALRHVVVPQAIRIVTPSVTNDFIALFKDTSICSVIGVLELSGRNIQLTVNHPGEVVTIGLMTALLYLMMSLPLAIVARRLETRFTPVNQ
jgi:polar amino acid transport system substrate-binding protein